jgi:hypothetical protein
LNAIVRRALVLLIPAAVGVIWLTSIAFGADDSPAGAGLHLRVTPLTRGVLPTGRFVARFSVNYSGPGRSGDIFLTFVAADGHGRKLRPHISAAGVRRQRPYRPGATSVLVNGVGSAGTRLVRATFTLRADGKICVRNAQAWLLANPDDFRAKVGGFCNYRR